MENKGTTTIEDLPDDCLMEIFERLPTVIDKISIELVCRKWRILSKKSWTTFKKLDFNQSNWGTRTSCFENRKFTMDNIDKIIMLCGKNLTSVSLPPELFWMMCRRTKNLRELRLIDMSGKCNKWSEIFDGMKAYSHNITEFQLRLRKHGYKHGEYSFTRNDFVTLVSLMKNLRTFYLEWYRMNDQNNAFLNHLPFDKIEKLYFFGCGETTRTLVSAVEKCSKLREFDLTFPSKVEATIFKAISTHANTMRHLGFNGIFRIVNSPLIRSIELAMRTEIPKLKLLEKLDLSFSSNFVTDDLVKVIADNCKLLTHFSISVCHKVSDKGVDYLAKLEKLIFLNISGNRTLHCPSLEDFEKLRGLNCRCCLDLDLESFINFLEVADDLKVIELTECKISFVKRIFDVAKYVFGSNNATLVIFIDKKTADSCSLDETSPFLKLKYDQHLRMDYKFD